MPTDGGGAGGSNFIGPGLTELANEQGGGASSGSITLTYETEGECGGGQLTGCGNQDRTLRRAGVVDGPIFHSLSDAFPECFTQGVRFQIASELPWIFAEPPTELRSALPLTVPECANAALTDEWPGDAGLVVEFTSGAGIMDGLLLTAVALQPGESDPTLRPPFLTVTVRNLPPGRRIIFDSAEHTIVEVEVSSGRVVGTIEHLDFAGPVKWLEVPPCGNVWACLDPTGATLDSAHTVSIEQHNREL